MSPAIPEDTSAQPAAKRGRCPRCGKNFTYRSVAEHECFPFCSSRCREVDLGNWLMGRYRLPGGTLPPDAEQDDSDHGDAT
jgi:endogenous inhibitor of DNA gyrase (YacG/DUF329 family)